jgi:hypothetical protein
VRTVLGADDVAVTPAHGGMKNLANSHRRIAYLLLGLPLGTFGSPCSWRPGCEP